VWSLPECVLFTPKIVGNNTEFYFNVFKAATRKATEWHVLLSEPTTVMCDFELAIINAAKRALQTSDVRCCLFHLNQNVYKRIQAEGLQEQYNDEEDRDLKIGAQMLCGLAFVPPAEVPRLFDLVRDEVPDDLLPVADYFETAYVRGVRARGRRRNLWKFFWGKNYFWEYFLLGKTVVGKNGLGNLTPNDRLEPNIFVDVRWYKPPSC